MLNLAAGIDEFLAAMRGLEAASGRYLFHGFGKGSH
jgi:hypothetical protein